MDTFKTFCGGVFLSDSDSAEIKLKNLIELDYYKTLQKNNNAEIYGIEVVKKEYKKKSNIETKSIQYISDDETITNDIIEKLMRNKVTPLTLQDVISDLLKCMT